MLDTASLGMIFLVISTFFFLLLYMVSKGDWVTEKGVMGCFLILMNAITFYFTWKFNCVLSSLSKEKTAKLKERMCNTRCKEKKYHPYLHYSIITLLMFWYICQERWPSVYFLLSSLTSVEQYTLIIELKQKSNGIESSQADLGDFYAHFGIGNEISLSGNSWLRVGEH